MKYPTITLEGNILSAELLERLEHDAPHQTPQSFGLDGQRVKDEIHRAWGEARLQWQVFKSKQERIKEGATGTSETRQFWMVPFLDTLGYTLTYQAKAALVSGETYDLSHREESIDGFPVHITGFTDSLDRRREAGGPRLSPHALVQEYLNLTEHLYAIVTNGYQLRLLRDSSRLTRLSYLEFDLVQMMEEEVYADFAILYRLLHRSRMPRTQETAEESVIEGYHQMALEAGARIRSRLSEAVKEGIERLAQALLTRPENGDLRQRLSSGEVTAEELYGQLLRLIYRLLFLLVIEERDLVFPKGGEEGATEDGMMNKREIYTRYYSISRLRALAERPHLADGRKQDLWISLRNTFRLFEDRTVGERLGIAPLAGELFGEGTLEALRGTRLSNTTLLYCLGRLTRFQDEQGLWTRVNYAALNVEEFGSVYEGLLEFKPYVAHGLSAEHGHGWAFSFREGEERSTTGSHYTPDELVRPLVEHALDPVIEKKVEAAGEGKETIEQALLSLKVCDVACGSGHFLLAAARRIAYELARTRTGEEQPNPDALRKATRDVIGHCIYGVDKNPMAVELCKVALWLEAHDPGKPLTFLDHRIKCGDAIVGVARAEDFKKGIPNDPFYKMEGDDNDVVSTLRKRNQKERGQRKKGDLQLELGDEVAGDLNEIATRFRRFEAMPDGTLEEREAKEEAYAALPTSNWKRLKQLADAQVAPFFMRKTSENKELIMTDGVFRRLLHSSNGIEDLQDVEAAEAVGEEKRFFHWFLEFPEVFADGGFDCILGNPPFLGGQKLSGTFGHDYLGWLKTEYAPAGAIDLVGYFFRRIFNLLMRNGAMGCLATATIAQGATREGGLAVIVESGGLINFAVPSKKWPGTASTDVALITIQKHLWEGKYFLDGKPVDIINSYLDDEEPLSDPFQLQANSNRCFQGSIPLGKGFVLEPSKASDLLAANPENTDVLFPYMNGADLNGSPNQAPSRWIINFHDWPLQKAQAYSQCFEIVENLVKEERATKKRKARREYWWLYAERASKLYRSLAMINRQFGIALTNKHHAIAVLPHSTVYDQTLIVFAEQQWSRYAILQSNIHEGWAKRERSNFGSTPRYSITGFFETFPFPHLSSVHEKTLEKAGACYHSHRAQLMWHLQLGLTKTYNLFHTPDLTAEDVARSASVDLDDEQAQEALADFERLRALHKEMDEAVRDAYGWQDVDLGHGFHEVEFLPENDRVRYTISKKARKTILRRLLLLNHQRYAEEQAERDGKDIKPLRLVKVADDVEQKSRDTTPEFKEAILISALVRTLATPEYPLGRKRYTKMSYLVHRKAEHDVQQQYLKKAAGPYSPWTRYGGPEKIAVDQNGYIVHHKAAGTKLEGYVPGDNIDKIDRYLGNYGFEDALRWVINTFRYRTNDDLELLTTVDFAALDLQERGAEVTAENVRQCIASEPEWLGKLKKNLFSTDRIEDALRELRGYFPGTYAGGE